MTKLNDDVNTVNVARVYIFVFPMTRRYFFKPNERSATLQKPSRERVFAVTFLKQNALWGRRRVSEQERQADETGRRGKHADSRCRGEPRDGGVQVAPSGAGREGG